MTESPQQPESNKGVTAIIGLVMLAGAIYLIYSCVHLLSL